MEHILKKETLLAGSNDARVCFEDLSPEAAAAAASSDKSAAQSVREKIDERYAACKAQLKENMASQLAERKARRDSDAAALHGELSAKLKDIDEKYAQLSLEQRAQKNVRKEYRDEVNGAKTVHLRSLRKLESDYEIDVVGIKSQEAYLCQARNQIAAETRGKKSDGLSLSTSLLSFKSSFNPKKTLTSKRMWVNLTPLLVLIALFAAYVITCNITGYKMNIDTIIISGIYVAIVAVGAVFIYSQGAFDMSLGNAALICAAVSIMSYDATGSIFLAFTLGIVLGVLLGVVNAILANCLKLPVMVMTLTMQSVLSAVYSNITSSSGGYIEVNAIRGIGGMTIKWIVLIAFIVLCVVLFNYSKIGRRNKMIGANATCAKFSGISLMKAGIISFAISGIGLGLCGFLYITQTGSVNTGTALTTVGLNVIIAINLGGMPTTGGPKSKISAAIIGGFFCTILDELFAAMGLDIYRYLAKGIIFLVAVCLTSLGDRPKRLA